MKRLKLEDFKYLTRTLSFNIYDITYAETAVQRHEYIEYINEEYNAERLTHILTDVCNIIGASILNIARHDYEPQSTAQSQQAGGAQDHGNIFRP